LPQPAPKRHRRSNGVHEPKGGQDKEALQHLRQKCEAEGGAGQHQPPRSASLERARYTVSREHEQQDQQRVRVVETEHQRGNRSDRENQAGQEGGGLPEPALDGRIEQRHCGNAFERLWQEHADAREAEQSR